MTPRGSTVGRARELAELGTRLDRALTGPAGSVLLVGEAGMGKTALLDAVAGTARRAKMRVVRARSPEGADASPFAGIADLVRGLADQLSQVHEDDAAVLRGAGRGGSAGSGRIATALLELLAEASHQQPVLLVLDDLQWTDRDSLDTLALAVGRLQSERVAVVGAARPRPVRFHQMRDWERIPVGPLDVDSAALVLAGHLPDGASSLGRPGDARARVLAEALGRCPLALVEAGRLLTAEQIDGTDPLPDPLPVGDRLMGAWASAWTGLEEPLRTAVLALCVTAGSPPGLLPAVLTALGLSPADLDPARCERLLVPSAPELGADLAHPLIRDAVLQAAGPASVRDMHRRAARCAADLGLAPSVVVAHLTAGALPGDEETIKLLGAQAERAVEARLDEVAGRALLAAAALTPSPVRRARLAARAAAVSIGSLVSLDAQIPVLVDADAVSALRPEERLWIEWARSESLVGEDLSQHLRAVEATVALARETQTPMLSWITASALGAAWCVGDDCAAMTHARALRDLADSGHRIPGDPMPPWTCRALHAITRFQLGDAAAAHDELEALKEDSRRWRPVWADPSPELTAVLVVDGVMGALDSWVDARVERTEHWFRRDVGQNVARPRRIQAERARRRGEFPLAMVLMDEARQLLREDSRFFRAHWLTASVLIRAALGGSAELGNEAAELRGHAQSIGWRTILAIPDRAEGLLALGEGRVDDALLHLEPMAEDQLLGCGPWDAVPMGRVDLVEALVRSGAMDRARAVTTVVTTTLGPSKDPTARGLVARASGLVHSGEDAQRRLERSAAAFEEAGDPFEAARSRLLLGELLRRERRTEDARWELRAAASAFERMGAAPWHARAVAELRATRAAVPAPTQNPLAALTPQERRVAEAVGAGATDRQAAADLFLSVRTVGYHLANVYRKLGISNRTALAARLAQARASAAQAGPG